MSEETQPKEIPKSKLRRILQAVGAVVVTLFVLWFLFGIPAYLLFGMFFE
ncbi:MAG: hypothetical protein O6766_13955 [Gammaproteobacteria bacterium]|jgi:hypothetical protein|nr:hypothetical protein [Gammaproteobacteria bacterium]